MISKIWKELVGNSAQELWAKIYLRDYHESGKRFNAPCDLSWRLYYFQHQLSRPSERLNLIQAEDRTKMCVVISGQIYDVGNFLYAHPGGHHVIADVLGTDATEVWEQFEHSESAQRHMKQLLIEDIPVLNKETTETTQLIKKGNLVQVIGLWEKKCRRERASRGFQKFAVGMARMFQQLTLPRNPRQALNIRNQM